MSGAHPYYSDRNVIEHNFGMLFKNISQDELYKACASYYDWDVNDEQTYDLEEFIYTDIQTLEGIKRPDKKALKRFNYSKL